LAVFLEVLKKAMEKLRREYLNPGIPKYITGVYEVYPPEHYVHVLLKHKLNTCFVFSIVMT